MLQQDHMHIYKVGDLNSLVSIVIVKERYTHTQE